MLQIASVKESIAHMLRFNTSRSRNAFASVSACLGKTADCTRTCQDYTPNCDDVPAKKLGERPVSRSLLVPFV